LYAAVTASVAVGGIVVFTVFNRAAQSRPTSAGPAARPGLVAGAGRSLIAFIRAGEGRVAIYVMNPDGSGQRLLAREAGKPEIFQMAWSPDGRQIAFGGCSW